MKPVKLTWYRALPEVEFAPISIPVRDGYLLSGPCPSIMESVRTREREPGWTQRLRRRPALAVGRVTVHVSSRVVMPDGAGHGTPAPMLKHDGGKPIVREDPQDDRFRWPPLAPSHFAGSAENFVRMIGMISGRIRRAMDAIDA
ncbi:hypothetical protein [Sorangium sp. So ce1182]|uniref:hypothetical protein n=1 Tax=Sorangium sp. So ce1182 TaxID=3133334 RepID=UPI003F61C5B1